MSNSKDKIIYETIKHDGWLAKEPIRIFSVAICGDGSGACKAWIYDGEGKAQNLKIFIISPTWHSAQFHFPDGYYFGRGCYVKRLGTCGSVIIGFKYE